LFKKRDNGKCEVAFSSHLKAPHSTSILLLTKEEMQSRVRLQEGQMTRDPICFVNIARGVDIQLIGATKSMDTLTTPIIDKEEGAGPTRSLIMLGDNVKDSLKVLPVHHLPRRQFCCPG